VVGIISGGTIFFLGVGVAGRSTVAIEVRDSGPDGDRALLVINELLQISLQEAVASAEVESSITTTPGAKIVSEVSKTDSVTSAVPNIQGNSVTAEGEEDDENWNESNSFSEVSDRQLHVDEATVIPIEQPAVMSTIARSRSRKSTDAVDSTFPLESFAVDLALRAYLDGFA